MTEEPRDATTGGPPEPAAPVRRGPGRNLPIAIAVGLFLAGLVVVSLYTVREIFLVVMSVFLVLGLRELAQAFAVRGIRLPLVLLSVSLAATVTAAYLAGPVGLLAAAALTLPAIGVWRLPGGPDGYLRDLTAATFSYGYVALMAGIVALMLAPDDGRSRIVVFVAVTVGSDIGGYFAGAFLGRHKLAPMISPKKTWEGLAGSFITCMLAGGWLVSWLLDGEIWQGALLGAAAVCSATLGDLIESMMKRDLGIKDMGALLPEHGGVMDRLDSLLATVPIAWLAMELIAPVT